MQLPDEIRKCVVYLLYINENRYHIFAGTGFFIGLQTGNVTFIYLVTAKHVIVGINQKSVDGKVIIRINDMQGGAKFVSTDVTDWIDHPSDSSIDIMALPCAPQQTEFDYRCISTTIIASDEIIKSRMIGIGDDVFITGLFINHFGKQRNTPIVRVGNIASMPEEKIDTRLFGSIEAYLIEARSIGGLSGSPVFVNLDPMRTGQLMFTKTGVKGGAFYLLGIIHGHWEINENEIDSFIQDITGGSINMGIAIVVPATKILEILNQPKLMLQRNMIIEEKMNGEK